MSTDNLIVQMQLIVLEENVQLFSDAKKLTDGIAFEWSLEGWKDSNEN